MDKNAKKIRFTGIQQLRTFLKTVLGAEYACVKVKNSVSGKTWTVQAFSKDPSKGSRGKKPYETTVRKNAETNVTNLVNYVTRSINGKL